MGVKISIHCNVILMCRLLDKKGLHAKHQIKKAKASFERVIGLLIMITQLTHMDSYDKTLTLETCKIKAI